MRILSIGGTNLASLAAFHLDFAAEPLRSSGLFAIWGRTGAGKSTVLDALCLALYGTTPRLKAASEPVAKVPDPSGGEGISMKSAVNLLRRGEVAGSARVEFVGGDGVTYRAEWSVRRAKGSVRGNPKLGHTLEKVLPGGSSLPAGGSTPTEALRTIQEKVGLTFEQFSRAVLLAQGEFGAFLKAKDTERADLLEQLTGLDLFSRISTLAYQRAAAEKQALAGKQAALGEVQLLSDEAVAEKSLGRDAARTAAAAAAAGAKLLAGQLQWHVDLAKREAELGTARRDLDEGQAGRAAALAELEGLGRAEKAQEGRRFLEEADRLQRELDGLRARQPALEAELAAAKAAEAAAQERLRLAEAAWAKEAGAREAAGPRLAAARVLDTRLQGARADQAHAREELAGAQEQAVVREATLRAAEGAEKASRELLLAAQAWTREQAAFGPLAQSWDRWRVLLEQAAEARGLEQQARHRHGAAQAAWSKRQAAWESARSDSARLLQRSQAADLATEQAERAAALFDGVALLARRKGLAERDLRLRDLGERLQKGADLRFRGGELRDRLGARRERRAQVGLELQGAQDAEAGARRAVELAGHAARALQGAATQHAEALRAKLVDGEPCAVCGSREHPYAAEASEVLRREVRRLDAELREREGALAVQVKRLAELGAEAAQLGRAIEEEERSAAALERESTAARDALVERMPGELRQLVEGAGEVAGLTWLDGERGALAAQLRSLEAEERSRLEAEAAQTLRRKEAAGARKSAEQAEAAAKGEQAALERLAGEVQSSADTAAAQAARAADNRELLAREGFDGGSGFDGLWEKDPAAAIRRQTLGVEAWRARQEEIARREKELLEQSGRLQQLRLGQEHGQQALEKAAAGLAERTALLDGLSRERAAVFAGSEWQGGPVGLAQETQKVEAELARRATQVEEGRNSARQALAPAAEAKVAQAGRVEQAKGESLRLAGEAETSRGALETWMAGALRAPAEGEAWLRSMLLTGQSTLAARRVEAQKVTGAYAQLAAVLQDRTGRLEEHRRLRPSGEPVEGVRSGLAEAERMQKEQEKACHSLDAELTRDAADRLRVAHLAGELDRQRRTLERWEQLSSLIGSENGKKFSKLAHELTLGLLVGYANQHLASLARRYRLKPIEATLGILVVDQDMGDEERSVYSLSGGESFLVSLALALGLASLSSSRVRVESLFIDEGFGSLDPETLGVAMDALDQLQAHGRKVGVISHVKEMAERIGTIVEVKKGPGGEGKVTVRGGSPADRG